MSNKNKVEYDIPKVFVIQKLVQLRVSTPEERAKMKDGDEETVRFSTFKATRDEVIEAGVIALRDRTHPNFKDWRTFKDTSKQDAQDAARYRWLRDRFDNCAAELWFMPSDEAPFDSSVRVYQSNDQGAALDAAIDAAMKESTP